MKKTFNRRRFKIINFKNISYLILIFILIIIGIYLYVQKKNILKIFNESVESFSKNFEYQFLELEVSGLDRTEEKFIKKILTNYLSTSIFTLPLEKISSEIRENNWVKNVKIKTNYKNTVYVEILEYKPLGIYSFNNKYFYFDLRGEIIEEAKKDNIYKNNNYIIFEGKLSKLKAKSILNILESLDFNKKYALKKIKYIKERRWDLILSNNIKLKLSENSPKKSLRNFINIEKNLSETEFNNIKSIDLRDINKTFINYKI